MKNNLEYRGMLRLCLIFLFSFFPPPYLAHFPHGHGIKDSTLLLNQQQQISGTVTDPYGPMPGVHVLIKGTNTGTFTDQEGQYSLLVNNGDTLVFSYLGYHSRELPVLGRTTMDVQMRSEVTELQEVEINAGYYTVKERERTGSIVRVASVDIEKSPVSNPLQTLQGRVSGLQVTQQTGVPGGGFDVRIRGRNSISSGNDPLYIINGAPYTAKNINSSTLGAPTGIDISPLNFINPNDIESIEVLKDADATAIYGSRGANGVILITTKLGKAEKTRVNIDTYSGIGKVSNKLDLLNRQQYLEMRNEAFANDGAMPIASDYDLNGKWDSSRETDWQDVLIGGTAVITNVHGTVSGGSKNTQFLLGGGYYKETTVFPGDFALKKTAFNSNLNHLSKDQKFSINFSFNYSLSNSNLLGTDLTQQAVNLSPVAPRLFNENGSLNWEDSTWTNPLYLSKQSYESEAENFIANAAIGYKLTPRLELKVNLGYTSLKFDEFRLSPLAINNPAWGGTSGSSTFGDNGIKSWIIEPQIGFNKEIFEGKLNILFGTSFQQEKAKSGRIFATGFPNDALLENLLAASTLRMLETNTSVYRYNALFGRINYNWQGRYILNLTARRDGSSRFGPDNQFANFGAVGGAWVFSKEKYLKDNPVVNFGKLRASYGITGNDQIGNYEFLDTYTSTSPYQDNPGLRPTRLFNPDFSWETTKKFEVGLELGLMRDRIFFSSSYYNNRSSDQLLIFPLAPTTGFIGTRNNLPATVENKGWEFELNTTNVGNGEFIWTTAFNISFPKNRLVNYPDLETSSFANTYLEGKSLFILNRLQSLGVDPATGLYMFEDVNENGNDLDRPADQQFKNSVEQKYYGGLQNSMSYKGFEFDLLFQFVKQTGFKYSSSTSPGTLNNQPNYVLGRWQQPGDKTDVQQYSQSSANGATRYRYAMSYSDQKIVDASFIRLQNLSLSYSFAPKSLEKWGLGNIRVFAQGQNLFTITKYVGLDPGNPTGIASRLPPLRVISLGLGLMF